MSPVVGFSRYVMPPSGTSAVAATLPAAAFPFPAATYCSAGRNGSGSESEATEEFTPAYITATHRCEELNRFMNLMTFHIYSAERPSGTKILACSASDATRFVDHRHLGRIWIILARCHHLNRTCGAMARAVAALHSVGERHAILPHPYGMAYLHRRLVGRREPHDGPCRTHFRTACAFGATIAALVRRLGLHQRLKVGRRAKHTVGTCRHTKLACGAMARHIAQAYRARRHYARRSARNLLVGYRCQASVYHLLLRLHRRSGGYGGSGRQKPAARSVGSRRRGGSLRCPSIRI